MGVPYISAPKGSPDWTHQKIEQLRYYMKQANGYRREAKAEARRWEATADDYRRQIKQLGGTP